MMRGRMRLISMSVLVLSTVAAPGVADPEAAGGSGATLTTVMTGDAEAPGPGDPDGAGIATVTLSPGQHRVCWELTVDDISPATAAHIHRAPPGTAGPVVVGLSPPDASGAASGCTTADRALIREILTSPSSFYVNVHNADYPAGAVRGQLGRP